MKLYCIKTDEDKSITKSKTYDLVKEEIYTSRIDGRVMIIYLVTNDNGDNMGISPDNFLPKHVYNRKIKWCLMKK